VFHPILGEYDPNDPYVVDWHIKWAVEHGVTLLVASMYEKRLEGLLNAKYLSFIKFAVVVDLSEIGGFRDPRNLSNVLEWVRNRCFLNPSYFTIRGRPVVFVGEANMLLRYLTIAELRSAFKMGRDYYRSQYGFEPFIIAFWNIGGFIVDEDNLPIPASADFELASLFDAVTVYGMPSIGGVGRTQGGKWILISPYDRLVSLYPTSTERLMRWVNRSGARFIPGALPGFNNSLLFKHGLDDWLIIRTGATADKFRTLLKEMRGYTDPELKLLLIDAWNEFSEGSVLEPTLEFGFEYLDAIREVFGVAPAQHEHVTPQDFAAFAVAEAKSAITKANSENRTEGLSEAERLLQDAESAMNQQEYREATALAFQAEFVASSATRPVLTLPTEPIKTLIAPTQPCNYLAVWAVLVAVVLIPVWLLLKRRASSSAPVRP
jgi:hypothetical protein